MFLQHTIPATASHTHTIPYKQLHMQVKVKVLHLYTPLSTVASKVVYNSLTTSRELTQPWYESSCMR